MRFWKFVATTQASKINIYHLQIVWPIPSAHLLLQDFLKLYSIGVCKTTLNEMLVAEWKSVWSQLWGAPVSFLRTIKSSLVI